jgi:hypothetical protein
MKRPQGGGFAMSAIRPQNRHVDNGRQHDGLHSRHLDSEFADIDALREENKQLRELVIQLSRLVIRNVVEGK